MALGHRLKRGMVQRVASKPVVLMRYRQIVHGETHNLADQMPGGFNATLFFEEVHYTMGAGWINIDTAAGATDPGNHGAQKVNAEFYKIWDRDCAT